MSSLTTTTEPRWPAFLQASFRGKRFQVLSAESDIGRRTVLYEFANRDTAYSVDLGQKAGRYSFTAVVFDAKSRDALRGEFTKPGSGTLVHPWWGELNVIIESCAVRETTDEAGIARIDIKAVEVVNEATGLKDKPDIAQKPPSTAQGLFGAAGQDFAKAMAPVTTASAAVRKSLTATVGSAVTEMRRVKGVIGSTIGVIDDVSSQITAVGDTASALILTPQALASSLTSLYASIFSSISKITTSIGSVARLLRTTMQSAASFGSNDPVIPTTTTQRVIEFNAHAALVSLVRASVIGAAASVIPDITYNTVDEAQALSDALSGLIDDLEGSVGDDTYNSLQDVRAAVSAFLETASLDLPLISEYTPIDTIPALCLAYSLYGDATAEADILIRNPSILNPVQVPGGVPLQVVSSV